MSSSKINARLIDETCPYLDPLGLRIDADKPSMYWMILAIVRCFKCSSTSKGYRCFAIRPKKVWTKQKGILLQINAEPICFHFFLVSMHLKRDGNLPENSVVSAMSKFSMRSFNLGGGG